MVYKLYIVGFVVDLGVVKNKCDVAFAVMG